LTVTPLPYPHQRLGHDDVLAGEGDGRGRDPVAFVLLHRLGSATRSTPIPTLEERCVSQRDRRDQQPKARGGKPGTAVKSRAADEKEKADAAWLDRLMERAAHPGYLTYLLAAAVILAAWVWPLAVVDPTSVHGAMRKVVPWIIAGVAALCFSTLTALLYSLALAGSSDPVKKFAAAVLNRAGIGAVLGALVSIRVAPTLLGKSSEGSTAPFADYLSNAGNIVTMFTFIFIATTWLYSLVALGKATAASVSRVPWLQQFSDSVIVQRIVPTVVMLGINLSAYTLATIVYVEIHRL
jgi:hypothetical protein